MATTERYALSVALESKESCLINEILHDLDNDRRSTRSKLHVRRDILEESMQSRFCRRQTKIIEELRQHWMRQRRMNNASVSVLTSCDLFRSITSYQNGIVEKLQPLFRVKGLWSITFSPRDFIAMHFGPFGRKREALLQCIIWDRRDLVIEFFRCFPTYAQDDYRFKEIVDAALILNRLDLFMILFQHRPMYECTPRVFLQAALRGHNLEHVQHIIAGKRRKRNEAYNERNVQLKNLD